MELIQQSEPGLPLSVACAALEFPRSTVYRRRRPQPARGPRVRPAPARRLSDPERAAILEILHSERFVDQPPAKVYATLLEEDMFLASPRTMYRVLAAAKETKERRGLLRSEPFCDYLPYYPNGWWSWWRAARPRPTPGGV
jgi:putative transposase